MNCLKWGLKYNDNSKLQDKTNELLGIFLW